MYQVVNRIYKHKLRLAIKLIVFPLGISIIYNYPLILTNIDVVRVYYLDLQYSEEPFLKESIDNLQLPLLVAHAGGGIDRHAYTNSKEAIDASYNSGLRFIEIDFALTIDGEVVLLHDWKYAIINFFSVTPGQRTLEEFKNLKSIYGYTQLTLDDLMQWLSNHDNVYIITDAKGENLSILKIIASRYPNQVYRIIPQIYFFTEWYTVRQLGYEQVILTLYRRAYTDDMVLKFVRSHAVTAVTMPISRGEGSLPLKLKNLGIPVYVHTVNDKGLAEELYRNGVYGVYTDFLTAVGQKGL